MKNKGEIIVVRGFNPYFDPPIINRQSRASYRTAAVIKKRHFNDEWQVYEVSIWHLIQSVAKELSAELKIVYSNVDGKSFSTLEEWRHWQMLCLESDPEFLICSPGEVSFMDKGNSCLCLMTFEDWSDIGKIEPYSSSYTYSFYSCNKDTDSKIFNAVSHFAAEQGMVRESVVLERNSPKWYWSIINTVRLFTR